MKKARKIILVTGPIRSGGTWTGKNLSLAPHTAYIHEPFNLTEKISDIKNHFDYRYQYICNENASKYREVFDDAMDYKYSLFFDLTTKKTAKNVARVCRDRGLMGLMVLYRLQNYRLIVKDPFAFFSADWLSKTYGMNVLVMIRHPAAFCSSFKIKNWRFNFNNFLNQPLLIERYLGVFEEKIREYAKAEKSIIDHAILFWNCIYHTVKTYQKEHPEWLFVRHEDLSNDPISQFQSIFSKFNLEFTPKVKSIILKNSGDHNPTEQQSDNEFVRNSKANIFNWKKRLTKDEIEKIKDMTHDVSSAFYGDHEW